MKNLLKFVAFSALVACGPLAQGNTASKMSAAVKSRFNQPDAASIPTYTFADLTASETPVILAAVPSLEVADIFQKIGSNGNQETWISSIGMTITLENGIVVATRGFGEDIYAADTRGLSAALGRGVGTYSRNIEHLDSSDEVIRMEFSCELEPVGQDQVTILDRSFGATKLQETCRSEDAAFANYYWVNGYRDVVQSQQWLGKSVGHATTQQF
ncbi:YjbF family lipoprotein [Marivivens donghaensis]|jgi:hypothetical protein|uniref:YjbF family lipoprotein n=1 Tax=Marivivens donghaensis TaxID=1699413 RepID=UPI003F6A0E46